MGISLSTALALKHNDTCRASWFKRDDSELYSGIIEIGEYRRPLITSAPQYASSDDAVAAMQRVINQYRESDLEHPLLDGKQ